MAADVHDYRCLEQASAFAGACSHVWRSVCLGCYFRGKSRFWQASHVWGLFWHPALGLLAVILRVRLREG